MPNGQSRRATSCAVLIGTLFLAAIVLTAADLPTPDAHFGFRIGADGHLASADAIEQYFDKVAGNSDRVRIVDLGRTTEGHRTPAAIVSAPENIQNLDRIKADNLRLADPRRVTPDEARPLMAGHKLVVAIGAGIHASEVGATQALNQLLFQLATADDPSTRQVLQNLVVIIIPSLNPDGQRMVVDWYNRSKGTPFEGGAMPWLDHKYAGHDLNRDGFMMNMPESRNLARFFYTEWHPQIFLSMHQMTSNGPRFFVPPNANPIDANYDPLIWRTAGLLGSAMALELQREGRTGVVSNAMFDYYWPGYEDSAPLGHNVICLLTEAASVKVATPVTLRPEDLRAGQKGLWEYRPQINFPAPWAGGPWTLRDIVDYNLTAVRGLLVAASAYRETLVQNFYAMGRSAIEAGRKGGPFAFLIHQEQFDRRAAAKLEELLLQGGVDIQRAEEPFRADGDPYPEGTDIILLAQPFRAYVKTLLEPQRYPVDRPRAGAIPDHPYDVAGWTLPLQMGVDVKMIERTFEPPVMSRLTKPTAAAGGVWGERRPGFYLVDARGNAGAAAINQLLTSGAAVSWLTSPMDADGYRYPEGSLVVSYEKTTEPIVAAIARDVGLRADGMKGKPPAGTQPIIRARVGLYKPWVENADAGWTRWVLEQHGFAVSSVSDADVRRGALSAAYDVIVLPNVPANRIVQGHAEGDVPPEYAGGLGDAGVQALSTFVREGGTLVCVDKACDLPIEQLQLQLRDVTRGADGFSAPGSIVRLELDATQPLAYGMPSKTAAFFLSSAAFEPADSAAPLRSVARYGAKDVLLSGLLEREQVIAGRQAVVEAAVGAGRVVMIAFPPAHRGQSLATFRLLFNAILTSQ